MSKENAGLPEGFEDLQPFVKEWGNLKTQDERYRRRQSLPMARILAYYEAVTPRLQSIFDHLDEYPFGEPLPASEDLLLRVVMGMSEVAHAVEMYGQPRVPHAPEEHSAPISGTSCA